MREPAGLGRLLRSLGLLVIALLALRSSVWRQASAEGSAPRPPAVLLVAHQDLAAAVEQWRAHRAAQGWRVEHLEVLASDAQRPASLQARIRQRAGALLAEGARRVDVLLLGDADVIPPFRFGQPDPRLVDRADREFASDHPYQLLDEGDELPDLALGRIPARTVEEALAVLAKIRLYETANADVGIAKAETVPSDSGADTSWRHRLTFVAGEGRFGPADSVLESLFRSLIERMVPESFELSMTYASPTSVYCPPPSQMERIVAGRFAEPALLVNYLGHGYARGLDSMRWLGKKVPLLTMASMPSFQTPRASLPIAFFGCCSVGWFDRPKGEPSLAEGLLLAPGGPVAIVAGSRPTHPYGTAILQKDLARRLLGDRVSTVGELDLEATRSMLQPDSDDAALDLVARPMAAIGNWPCSLPELRLMHVRMYNLLGDPCTRIALPPGPLNALRLEGRTLRGDVPGMVEGTVEVVLETAREACAAGPLSPAGSPHAPDLEALALENYPRANARTLWRGSAPIAAGSFSVDLPDPMPAEAAIVRSVVRGRGPTGEAMQALDGLRLGTERR